MKSNFIAVCVGTCLAIAHSVYVGNYSMSGLIFSAVVTLCIGAGLVYLFNRKEAK